MKFISNFFICILYFGSNAQHNLQSIYFVQNNNTIEVEKENGTVKLHHGPLAIRFYNKQYDTINNRFYAARIVIRSKEDTTNIRVGKTINTIHCFLNGTGVATDPDGKYNEAYIQDEGYRHHYLQYGSYESSVFPVSKQNDMMELEWKISRFYECNDCKELYLISVIDYNLNNIIDPGELHKVKMIFK